MTMKHLAVVLAKLGRGGGVGERGVAHRPQPVLLRSLPLRLVAQMGRQQPPEQLRGGGESGAQGAAEVPPQVRLAAQHP